MLSGVPQGSVLGPLLYVIFINDIDKAVECVTIIEKFADDTKVRHIVTNPTDPETLQTALNNLSSWADLWRMRFNTDKCKVMHVGRGNSETNYLMNNQVLSKTEKERDIGVIIHKSLKQSLQCKEASRKANGVLTQIARSFHYRDRKSNLYTTYVTNFRHQHGTHGFNRIKKY